MKPLKLQTTKPTTHMGIDMSELSPPEVKAVCKYLETGDHKLAFGEMDPTSVDPEKDARRFFTSSRIKGVVDRYKDSLIRTHESLLLAIIKQYKNIALSDMAKVADWDSRGMTLVPGGSLDPEVSGTIQEIKFSKYGPSLKMYDKLAALKELKNLFGIKGEGVDDEEEKTETLLILPDNHRTFTDDDI